ncbi:hypothetical protein RSAG8_00840, partial [Rhizoctonia solani AG-8 WAC10335]
MRLGFLDRHETSCADVVSGQVVYGSNVAARQKYTFDKFPRFLRPIH